MDTPGKVLKTERERQKKSLKKLAKILEVRVDYLKAIEDENYQFIPGEVFIKGYLRFYAEALGFKSDYILNLYKRQKDACLAARKPAPSKKKIIFTKLEKIFLPVFAHKAILIILLVLIVISAVLFTTFKEQKPVVELKEPEVVVDKKPEKLSLIITATELTWISVGVDGDKPQEWSLKPGETVTVTAFNRFSIRIGNAAGVKLTFNGEELGELGPHGKVVDIILPHSKNE